MHIKTAFGHQPCARLTELPGNAAILVCGACRLAANSCLAQCLAHRRPRGRFAGLLILNIFMCFPEAAVVAHPNANAQDSPAQSNDRGHGAGHAVHECSMHLDF